jgi:hypothetical protein
MDAFRTWNVAPRRSHGHVQVPPAVGGQDEIRLAEDARDCGRELRERGVKWSPNDA